MSLLPKIFDENNRRTIENHLLGILGELGYSYENGYEIAPELLTTDY